MMAETVQRPSVGQAMFTNEMRDSQKALELRKFFAPFDPLLEKSYGPLYNSSLVDDGALDAYAESLVWRLRGVRSMVSLIDGETQYFLAGATKEDEDGHAEVHNDGVWFGCNTVPTPGGLCENTLAIDPKSDDFPCFQVLDLRADERFAGLPVVDGTIVAYRFYAGTPITTDHGVNIGSLFMFDDKPRPNGLNLSQKKHLYLTAANVMKHLETKREAAERRRAALMSAGNAKFLEETSRETEMDVDNSTVQTADLVNSQDSASISTETSVTSPEASSEGGVQADKMRVKGASERVLDKIKMTLDQAANIIRESLELSVGGVILLDTALGHNDASDTDAYFSGNVDLGTVDEEMVISSASSTPNISPGLFRNFNDQYKPAKVLAMSLSKATKSKRLSTSLDGKTLQTLISLYPKGNIWYIDEKGFFSSLEQINLMYEAMGRMIGRRSSMSQLDGAMDITRQKAEADLLSKIFRKARQIIFLPLWDAGSNRWHSGCFVWSQSAVPVFTVESEVSFLSSFLNSVMVEISRLDAITANKMKSNFISSISHEFRSPLHGILASAEFLRESHLDNMQAEFISTIQNCGSTLLDTINHVLDYSKINSFEKKGLEKGMISNELEQVINVALLCEDIVNGMIAAREFKGVEDVETNNGHEPRYNTPASKNHPVEIILDFEQRNWDFKIQPGALRRVIMNLFGNAQKYTQTGFIYVQLRILEANMDSIRSGEGNGKCIKLNVIDSGRGMSSEYMSRKLYTPFAQEDSFAPGVGLGLSIVWSIVSQLGGKIHVRSELGKGTDVEVNFPVDKLVLDRPGDTPASSSAGDIEAQHCLETIRKLAKGKRIMILRDNDSVEKDNSATGWQCIEKYCSSWYGFTIISPNAEDATFGLDLVITDMLEEKLPNTSHVLLIREDIASASKRRAIKTNLQEYICTPLGPYKLARSILSLFERKSKGMGSNVETTVTEVKETTPSKITHSGPDLVHNDLDSTKKAPLMALNLPGEQNSHPTRLKQATFSLERPQTPEESASQALNSLKAMSLQSTPKVRISSNANSQTKARPQPQAALSLLAVDDNTLNLQLLHRYLMKRKVDTIVLACNGVEAVTAVQAAEHAFDIVFMDISMPEMDGFEATRQIRDWERDRNRGRAYVVALTGLASRRDRDEAEQSGFDDFLTKPISFGRIGELVKRVSAEKELRGGSMRDAEDT